MEWRKKGRAEGRKGREGRRTNVEEPILVLVLLIDGTHQGGCWREDLQTRIVQQKRERSASSRNELRLEAERKGGREMKRKRIERTSSTKMKIAFSAGSLIRFLITYTNCPTVRSCFPTTRKSDQLFELRKRGRGKVKLNGREGLGGERRNEQMGRDIS